MTDTQDLDPQEAIEQGYDAYSDITAEEEAGLAPTPEDEVYVPEPVSDACPCPEGAYPDDRLVIPEVD